MTLDINLLWGARVGRFLMSEVPLYLKFKTPKPNFHTPTPDPHTQRRGWAVTGGMRVGGGGTRACRERVLY